MKKQYEKPMVHMEHFSLSQSVATACGASHDSTLGKPSYGDKNSCGWDMGNLIIWVQGPSCDFLLDEDVPFEGVCYNNPGGGAAIFSFS